MTREEAIFILVQKQLNELSLEDRTDHLERIALEPWSEELAKMNISPEVIAEFESGELLGDLSSSKYDAVLKFWLAHKLREVTNEYISSIINSEITSGCPVELEACPCCGYRTLEEKNSFDICKVCWWEDDGQDNNQAEEVYGGPNEVSLIQARYNFIQFSTYNPEREDLLEFHEPKSKYVKGRNFILEIGGDLTEENTNWRSNQYVKTKT